MNGLLAMARAWVSSPLFWPLGTAWLGFLCLSGMVWWLGNYFGLSDWLQWILVLLPWVGAIGWTAWKVRRQKERNADLVGGMIEVSNHGSDERTELRSKFEEAVGSLKSKLFVGRGGAKRTVYELPWYVFIGPPGSGKTTALENCGLEFPLKDFGRGNVLKGVGGTKSLDFWFSNEAVFIDTAGRYTTQDSDTQADRTGWEEILGRLKKTRPQEPVNGLIVVLSVQNLIDDSDEDLERHGDAIRKRIQEMYSRLGPSIPVYVLFSKTDLVSGFKEFFGGFGRDDRQQVWGVTAEKETLDDPKLAIASVQSGLEDGMRDLGGLLVQRLHDVPDAEDRLPVTRFPGQFAQLKTRVDRFLANTFSSDRYSRPILFRGAYFISGTQEGAPFDLAVSRVREIFGMEPSALISGADVKKAYFLHDLFHRVVFREQGLVQRIRRRDPVRERLAFASMVGLGLLTASVCGAMLWVLWQDLAWRDRLQVELGKLATTVEAEELDPADESVASAQPQKLRTLLEGVSGLKSLHDEIRGARGWSFGVGRQDNLLQDIRKSAEAFFDRQAAPRLEVLAWADLSRGIESDDFNAQKFQLYGALVGKWKLEPQMLEPLIKDKVPGSRDNLLFLVEQSRGKRSNVAPDLELVKRGCQRLFGEGDAGLRMDRFLAAQKPTLMADQDVQEERKQPTPSAVLERAKLFSMADGIHQPQTYTRTFYRRILRDLARLHGSYDRVTDLCRTAGFDTGTKPGKLEFLGEFQKRYAEVLYTSLAGARLQPPDTITELDEVWTAETSDAIASAVKALKYHLEIRPPKDVVSDLELSSAIAANPEAAPLIQDPAGLPEREKEVQNLEGKLPEFEQAVKNAAAAVRSLDNVAQGDVEKRKEKLGEALDSLPDPKSLPKGLGGIVDDAVSGSEAVLEGEKQASFRHQMNEETRECRDVLAKFPFRTASQQDATPNDVVALFQWFKDKGKEENFTTGRDAEFKNAERLATAVLQGGGFSVGVDFRELGDGDVSVTLGGQGPTDKGKLFWNVQSDAEGLSVKIADVPVVTPDGFWSILKFARSARKAPGSWYESDVNGVRIGFRAVKEGLDLLDRRTWASLKCPNWK